MPWWNPASWLKIGDKGMDIADKVISGAIGGIDALIFTDQEKAEFNQKRANLWLKTQEVLANENTAKSITRRILAVMVMASFLFLLLFAVGIYKFDQGWAKFSLDVAGTLSTGFTAIIIFYFGYYAVGNLIDKRNNKS